MYSVYGIIIHCSRDISVIVLSSYGEVLLSFPPKFDSFDMER